MFNLFNSYCKIKLLISFIFLQNSKSGSGLRQLSDSLRGGLVRPLLEPGDLGQVASSALDVDVARLFRAKSISRKTIRLSTQDLRVATAGHRHRTKVSTNSFRTRKKRLRMLLAAHPRSLSQSNHQTFARSNSS